MNRDEDRDALFALAIIAIVVAYVSLGVWWIVVQWQECSDAALSVLYCIKHVL